MKNILLVVFLLLGFTGTMAQASCSCICVGNQKQQVCANTWDIPVGYCGGYCSN